MEDLAITKQASFSSQARYLGGQVNNRYRRIIDSLTQLVMEDLKVSGQGVGHTPTTHGLHNEGVVPYGFEC